MSKEETEIPYPAPIVIEFIRYFGLLVGKIFWQIKFYGTENIPRDLAKGLLLVSNHQTYFDPFWLCLPIHRKFRFLAWDKAFEWFVVGPLIKYLGAFPVNLERGNKKVLVESLKSLRDGATLIIFPEGSRAFADGKLLPFKPGAARIAMEAGVPILPVTIRGANKVWAQDAKFPRPGKVEIFYHPIFEIPQFSKTQDKNHSAEIIIGQLKEIIESAL